MSCSISTSEWLGTYYWTVHGGQLIPGDAAVLPQEAPEVIWVAGVQTAKVGLADVDVLWSCVGVQLLVPLLQEALLYALEMMAL